MTSVAWSGLVPGVSSETLARTFDDDFRVKPETLFSASYGREALGRIETTAVHYDLDANGNRLRRAVEDTSTSTITSEELGEYDVQGRLTHYNGKTYAYTARGTLETVTDDTTSDVTTYTYDALGNLRQVDFPDSSYVEYVVDGMNRRVAKKVNGTLRKAWGYEDQLRIAAELDFDTDGTTQLSAKRFGYGTKSNVPDVMVIDDFSTSPMTTTRYRVLSDHLGSVRMVVSEDGGTILTRMDFDEFGRLIPGTATGVGVVPFGFAGGLYDDDTGLVRFGARDYDPVTGRWTARDPIGFDGGQENLYTYALDNPVGYRDENGLQSQADCDKCNQEADDAYDRCASDCIGKQSDDGNSDSSTCQPLGENHIPHPPPGPKCLKSARRIGSRTS